MQRLWQALISLELGLWLLGLVAAALAAGSFLLTGEYAAAINSLPLFGWLAETPLSHAWWLWLAVVLLGLLVANTLCCSIDTLCQRWRRMGPVALVAPQFVHAGFLLIVVAHLMSAMGSSVERIPVTEGTVAHLPDARPFGVAAITVNSSPTGMALGFSAELAIDPRIPGQRVVISPIHPWFSNGYGVYIKQATLYPYPRALLEVHREPGAGLALVGAAIFVIGNVLVLWLRSKREETGRMP
jgi:hypothetical protein